MTRDPFDMLRPVGEPMPLPPGLPDPFDILEPVRLTAAEERRRDAARASQLRREEEELERLLWWMPAAAERAGSGWARQFADSMAKKGRRRGWRPTPRQRETMAGLVADMIGRDGEEVLER